MDGTYSTHGETRDAFSFFFRKYKRKGKFARLNCGLGDYIELKFRETK
jgi:hypothetical protein